MSYPRTRYSELASKTMPILGDIPLTDEQRRLVAFFGVNNTAPYCTYEHAAQEFSIPIGTVRSRLSRARSSMIRFMNTREVA